MKPVMIMKNGFMNSEGCMENPARLIHLLAPLTSEPVNNTLISSMMPRKNPIRASLLIVFGERREIEKMVMSDAITKKLCLLTKWKVSKLMRSATEGLAAVTIIVPMPMIISIVSSVILSIVHHQELKMF